MTSYVYGPVPSRRLGQSLGVDPIPFKTCNYNCVYCQLGRTTPLINERRDFFPREGILAQVRDVLERHEPGEIDYVTFVGQGEPMLCASLGVQEHPPSHDGHPDRRSTYPAQRPHAGPDLREVGHPSDATPERCGGKSSFLPGWAR